MLARAQPFRLPAPAVSYLCHQAGGPYGGSLAKYNNPLMTADFVVTLNRKSSGTVTVMYSTQNVTAIGGQDYENTNGTLTFQPGETSKIISIPIIDDTVNDNGETFELFLFNPKGADIARMTGIGTIFNTEILTGSFENVPGEHDGSTPFTFDAVFNSDIGISYATLRDHSFTVTNGKVTGARRNNGRNDSWEITVTPWGNDAVTVTLPGNRDCGTTAAICTKEDHPVQLSNSPSAMVAGPPGPEAAADGVGLWRRDGLYLSEGTDGGLQGRDVRGPPVVLSTRE